MIKQYEAEIGQVYWGIHTGYGYDEIHQVKITEKRSDESGSVYYRVNDVDNCNGIYGTRPKYLFHSKAEAEMYRDGMAIEKVIEYRNRTDTPEKMLKYLISCLDNESDGYCAGRVNRDIAVRAQELFGIKIE